MSNETSSIQISTDVVRNALVREANTEFERIMEEYVEPTESERDIMSQCSEITALAQKLEQISALDNGMVITIGKQRKKPGPRVGSVRKAKTPQSSSSPSQEQPSEAVAAQS